jgi:hypothetical protein
MGRRQTLRALALESVAANYESVAGPAAARHPMGHFGGQQNGSALMIICGFSLAGLVLSLRRPSFSYFGERISRSCSPARAAAAARLTQTAPSDALI